MRTLSWRVLAPLVVLGLLLAGLHQRRRHHRRDRGRATGATDDAGLPVRPTSTAATEAAAGEPTEEQVATAAGDSPTLAEVQERGTLNCGVNGQLAGFSLNEGGTYTGFDVDYCRAVAAVVLGDPEAVTYVDLTADTRFTALQSGEIDVLIRNSHLDRQP